MKKKLLSALLTVVMIVTMLTAMCPGALAVQTVELEVDKECSGQLDTITDSDGNTIGLTDGSAVVSTTSQTQNGITVTAALSEDQKTLNITYSGTPVSEGKGLTFNISYSIAGENLTYTVMFDIIRPKTEVYPPEVLSAEPSNLNQSLKQTDGAKEFKVEAQGNGEISYRWRVDGTEVATGNTFTIVAEDMDVGSHTVECVISNTVKEENTTKYTTITWSLTIEEGDAPKITSEATSGKIDGTGSASFSVTAEGDGLKYQWYMVSGSRKEKVVDGTYGAIEYKGATTDKLTVKCTLAPQDASTKFVCEVTNANGLTTATEEYALKITEDPNAEKVQEIVIVKGPSKTTYVVGETLDEEGLKIKVITGKDEEELTSGFVCSPLYLDEEGTQTITVSYGGKTTTFTVTVEPAPHEHEWSDWKVDNGTSVKVYRECIGGDDCTAKEVMSKDTFIVEYPTIAAELGLTMGDDSADTDADKPADTEEPDVDTDVSADSENDKDKDKNKDKKSGNGILWAIIIIALILLAAVIFYYFKIYRKPYKKPTNNNRRR